MGTQRDALASYIVVYQCRLVSGWGLKKRRSDQRRPVSFMSAERLCVTIFLADRLVGIDRGSGMSSVCLSTVCNAYIVDIQYVVEDRRWYRWIRRCRVYRLSI